MSFSTGTFIGIVICLPKMSTASKRYRHGHKTHCEVYLLQNFRVHENDHLHNVNFSVTDIQYQFVKKIKAKLRKLLYCLAISQVSNKVLI